MSNKLEFNAQLHRKITFRLDQKHFADLCEISSQEGFGVSAIVRHLVFRYIEQNRRLTPMLRSVPK